MAFERSDFALFWSLSPDSLDWSNLAASRVKTVMLPYALAQNPLLAHLRDAGRSVVVRLTPEDLQRNSGAQLRQRIATMQGIGNLRAVITGCEPEIEYNFDYGYPWRQDQAYREAERSMSVLASLTGLTVPLVAAPLSPHGVGLGETDPLYPGLFSWREILAPVYHQYQGVGVHGYTHNYQSAVDTVRLQQSLRFWASFWHKPIWVDELGINTGSWQTRMTGYLDTARWLCQPDNPVGERVEMLAFFISNGDGKHWDASYVIREPEAYLQIGQFMQEGET
jgi:hypothetical protein